MIHPRLHRPHFALALSLLAVATLALGLACSTPSKPKGGRTILMSEDDPKTDDESSKAKPRPTVLRTRADDARVGKEASKQVASQIGLLDDAALAAYVQQLGSRLARGVPRSSGYQFKIVDQVEPNAFALPGGYIFLSRGLIALANSEDELACVIGHEITHAARRHSARQQAIERAQPISMPWIRARKLASYSRDMEREADKGGQRLAAASGYDPMGMSTFLRNLERTGRVKLGYTRLPSFFDTHPDTGERVGVNAVGAKEIRWKRDPALGDTRTSYLNRIEGLALGQRPGSGVFEGRLFLHPLLDFQLLFPTGWQTSNSGAAVGATEPRGAAVIYLQADPPAESLEKAAQALFDEAPKGAKMVESKAIAVGSFDGWRLELSFPGNVRAIVTLIDAGEVTFRITGMARMGAIKRFRGRIVATPRSFRRLTPEQKAGLRVTRLRLARARPSERLGELSRRTGNTWNVLDSAVLNGLQSNDRFEGGELVKIALEEAWTPPAAPPPKGTP
ncbi:MAG: M48 family metalloprotease [Deltaproteobacteria bacterium]|nr:M48 family metalloprotease [Deltaproteobacteria bacterium]MBW2393999.1 M48 family metalloprotease [Deltaproteobacteria bacterium]